MVLERLRNKLIPWSLFSDSLLDRDLDAYIDWRDSDSAFETEWLRVFNEVKARDSHNIAVGDEVNDIVREIFLRASRLTRQHEIASYIGDDFELVSNALITGYSDPWLNGLYLSYKESRLPDSLLTPVPGALADLI